MATVSLATLLLQETKEAIYEKAINLAIAVGLPVSSWQAGDPTRSLYHLEAEILAALEVVVVNFIRSGFLDYAAEAAASGDDEAAVWLKIRAEQDYNVTVPGASAATTDVVLTNGGGGFYEIDAGDLTFRSSLTDKTYRNTTGGTLNSGPGTTLTVTVVADEPGSASSAGAGEIDELVTTLLGVTCSNATAAIGIDEQSPATTVRQCRDKLGTLSFMPPKEAFTFVARESTLTGTTAVTRARSYSDSDTGEVLLYLAGPSGGVTEPDRALVEDAILQHATGLCITPTVASATAVPVAITYELWAYKGVNRTAAELQEDVEASLEQMFATRDIGGDITAVGGTGKLYTSLIKSTILGTHPQIFRVELSAPAIDVALTNAQVATLGTVTGTIHMVVNP